MSDTTETEVGKGAGDPAPEPAPAESTSEPREPAAATPEADEAEAETKRENRRVAQLRARLGAAERERERQAVELEFYRRQAQQQHPAEETPEEREARRDREADARAEAKLTTRRFHEDGATQYPDWQQRCADLIAMGADPGFARLLVEMPGGDGVKVAAALAADPDTVERIANLSSERARAVALGKYAATLDDTARPARRAAQVTQAPAPVRPVTGRASPSLNEYAADANTLVDKYMRDNMDRQRRR